MGTNDTINFLAVRCQLIDFAETVLQVQTLGIPAGSNAGFNFARAVNISTTSVDEELSIRCDTSPGSGGDQARVSSAGLTAIKVDNLG